MRKLIAIILLLAGAFQLFNHKVKAQNPSLTPSTLTVPATVLHTNCVVAAGTTTYCFAGDGLWISSNGAPFAQLQGQSGVISVNGKTGTVVLSATTSLQ